MCYILLDVTGPSRDLHSGSFGGGINNPLNVLAHIIARLKDEEGRVLIRYSGTEPLLRIMLEGENEKQILELAHDIASEVEKSLGGRREEH